MNKRQIVVTGVVTLALVGMAPFLLKAAAAPSTQPSESALAKQKWIYQVCESDKIEEVQKILDQMAANGWELVNGSQAISSKCLYFKKPFSEAAKKDVDDKLLSCINQSAPD